MRMKEEPFTKKDDRKHFQWFHFRITGAGGRPLKVVIDNADQASPNSQAYTLISET